MASDGRQRGLFGHPNQQKKIEALMKELRSLPANKRCFNCDALGTTYIVPAFSIFVCMTCSGMHMNLGQRVKSVTLGDYKPEDVVALEEGGNEAAAIRYLAKYVPGRDKPVRPVDKQQAHIRQWIQAVFVEKRFYSPEAPLPPPRRVSHELSDGGGSRKASDSLSRRVSTASNASGTAVEAPVRDVRELLGDKAPSLQIGPRVNSLGSAGGAASAGTSAGVSASASPRVSSSAASAPAAMAAPAAAPPPPKLAPVVDLLDFDAFGPPATAPAPAPAAAPAAAAAVPAAAVFDPFMASTSGLGSTGAVTAAPSTTSAFGPFAGAGVPLPAHAVALAPALPAVATAPTAPTLQAADSDWATFDSPPHPAAATPAAPATPGATAAVPSPSAAPTSAVRSQLAAAGSSTEWAAFATAPAAPQPPAPPAAPQAPLQPLADAAHTVAIGAVPAGAAVAGARTSSAGGSLPGGTPRLSSGASAAGGTPRASTPKGSEASKTYAPAELPMDLFSDPAAGGLGGLAGYSSLRGPGAQPPYSSAMQPGMQQQAGAPPGQTQGPYMQQGMAQQWRTAQQASMPGHMGAPGLPGVQGQPGGMQALPPGARPGMPMQPGMMQQLPGGYMAAGQQGYGTPLGQQQLQQGPPAGYMPGYAGQPRPGMPQMGPNGAGMPPQSMPYGMPMQAAMQPYGSLPQQGSLGYTPQASVPFAGATLQPQQSADSQRAPAAKHQDAFSGLADAFGGLVVGSQAPQQQSSGLQAPQQLQAPPGPASGNLMPPRQQQQQQFAYGATPGAMGPMGGFLLHGAPMTSFGTQGSAGMYGNYGMQMQQPGSMPPNASAQAPVDEGNPFA